MVVFALALAACTPRVEEDAILSLPLPSQACQGGYGNPVELCVVDTEEGTRKRLRVFGLQPNSLLRVALASSPMGEPGRHVKTVRADKQGQITPVEATEFEIPGTTFVLLAGTSLQHEPVTASVVVTTDVPVEAKNPPG